MKSEKDIFNFLGLEYKEPNERINESSIVEKKKILTLKDLAELKKTKKKTNKNKNKQDECQI